MVLSIIAPLLRKTSLLGVYLPSLEAMLKLEFRLRAVYNSAVEPQNYRWQVGQHCVEEHGR